MDIMDIKVMSDTYQRMRFSFLESMSFEDSIQTIRKGLMMVYGDYRKNNVSHQEFLFLKK